MTTVIFFFQNCKYFSYPSVLTFVVSAQKAVPKGRFFCVSTTYVLVEKLEK